MTAINVRGQGCKILMNILPPYTSSINDYGNLPGKVSIQVVNNSPVGGALNTYIDLIINGPNDIIIKTPEGKKVLVVLNDGDVTQTFNIKYKGRKVTATLNSGSVATFVW